MRKRNAKLCAVLGLMLLVSGCGSEVNAVIKDCLFDFAILPSIEDIDTMSDELALRIDEHDELYQRNCGD